MPVENPLHQFEIDCQASNPTQRERIALAARDFLIESSVPDGIATELEDEYNRSISPIGDATPFPDGDLELNDVLCAQLEARLANFFPAILHFKETLAPAAFYSLMAKAGGICQKVDAWRNYHYWAPLLDYLKNAAAATDRWRLWRIAAIAQQKARVEISKADFERAKNFAIYGLQSVAKAPDHRLYLDLCSRLENALAEGNDACLCLATTLGYWVIKESLAAGHYLRAVGMRQNLGNQFLLAGKNAEAITVLEQAQALCETQWPIKDMNYYQINVLERLAQAYRNRGEVQRATDYLEKFHLYARQPKDLALYHLGKGYLALYAGASSTADNEFKEACTRACGSGSKQSPDDFFNLWSAHVSLAFASLKLQKVEEASQRLADARLYGRQKKFLDHPDRMIHDGLTEAAVCVLGNKPEEAKKLVEDAKTKLVKGLFDPPRRRMQMLLLEAELQSKPEDAQRLRAEAIQLAQENGFNTSNLEWLKIAVFG